MGSSGDTPVGASTVGSGERGSIRAIARWGAGDNPPGRRLRSG